MGGNNYIICKAKNLSSNNLLINCSSFEKDVTRHLMSTPLGNQLVLFPLNLSVSFDQSLGYLINRDKTLISCRTVSYTHLTLPTTPYV